MIRLVLGEDRTLSVDLAGRSFGRGAWVHARPDCLSRAASGGAAKGLKSAVVSDASALCAAVRAAADRRVEALLASANGARRVTAGTDAVRIAHERGDAHVVLLATDARAASTADWLQTAGAEGRVLFWGTKEKLGRAIGRSDTAVVAIADRGLSSAIAAAIALSSLPEPNARPAGGGQALVEVR